MSKIAVLTQCFICQVICIKISETSPEFPSQSIFWSYCHVLWVYVAGLILASPWKALILFFKIILWISFPLSATFPFIFSFFLKARQHLFLLSFKVCVTMWYYELWVLEMEASKTLGCTFLLVRRADWSTYSPIWKLGVSISRTTKKPQLTIDNSAHHKPLFLVQPCPLLVCHYLLQMPTTSWVSQHWTFGISFWDLCEHTWPK